MRRQIKVGDFKVTPEIRQAVNDVLDSGQITEGQITKRFEKEFAKYIGTKYCVAVNSGTSALMCAISSLRENYNQNYAQSIITTPLTYVATSNAIMNVNSAEERKHYLPVYVDIEPETFTIDTEQVKEHIERYPGHIFAVLPVHLFGYPCNMSELTNICDKNCVRLIEDSAQAHGTRYYGGKYSENKTGSMSDFGTFSFYVAHNIQAGEFGAVTTDDEILYSTAKKIKANGRMCRCSICRRKEGLCPFKDKEIDPRFTHEFIGYNLKPTEFSSAIALTQLKYADGIIFMRQENVKYLNDCLEGVNLRLPKFSRDVSYLSYPMLAKNKSEKWRIISELESRGIECRTMFPCIPTQQPAYDYYKVMYEGRLPNAEHAADCGFYIGCHQYLEESDLDYIVKNIKEVV